MHKKMHSNRRNIFHIIVIICIIKSKIKIVIIIYYHDRHINKTKNKHNLKADYFIICRKKSIQIRAFSAYEKIFVIVSEII